MPPRRVYVFKTMQRSSCIESHNIEDANELQDPDVPRLGGEGSMRSPSMRLCSRTCGAEVGAGRCPWKSHGAMLRAAHDESHVFGPQQDAFVVVLGLR